MFGLSSPASAKMSATPSATIALSKICFSALFFSSVDRFLSTVVNLVIAALMAEKKAISLRNAAASSSVPHSE